MSRGAFSARFAPIDQKKRRVSLFRRLAVLDLKLACIAIAMPHAEFFALWGRAARRRLGEMNENNPRQLRVNFSKHYRLGPERLRAPVRLGAAGRSEARRQSRVLGRDARVALPRELDVLRHLGPHGLHLHARRAVFLFSLAAAFFLGLVGKILYRPKKSARDARPKIYTFCPKDTLCVCVSFPRKRLCYSSSGRSACRALYSATWTRSQLFGVPRNLDAFNIAENERPRSCFLHLSLSSSGCKTLPPCGCFHTTHIGFESDAIKGPSLVER